jgi:uncharacterized membrane protein
MEVLMTVFATLALLGSLVVAGVFFAFSSFVMRALARLPAERGIAAMQSINVVVLNWHFLGVFSGTALVAVLAIASAAASLGAPDARGAVSVACGSALYLVGTFLVTGARNVPLNQALARLEPEAPEDAERWPDWVARWTRWNHVRTIAAFVAALVLLDGLARIHGTE